MKSKIQDRKNEAKDKKKKMFGTEVSLPMCGKPAIDIRMHACLACDWEGPSYWNK